MEEGEGQVNEVGDRPSRQGRKRRERKAGWTESERRMTGQEAAGMGGKSNSASTRHGCTARHKAASVGMDASRDWQPLIRAQLSL
jgi:hypothetical protein